MASLSGSSSSRSSSSTSFRSSSCFSGSSSSSFRAEGVKAPKTDALFQPFVDAAPHPLFTDQPPFPPPSQTSYNSHPVDWYGGYQANMEPYRGFKGDREPSGGYQSDREFYRGYQGDRESFGSYQGDEEPYGSFQGDRESKHGYQGDQESFGGYQGDWSLGDSFQGAVSGTGRPASMGVVRAVGDSYFLSADVSQFQPHDVVVMAYNHNLVIHAEKVAEDGSVSDTFTHKSLLPQDMDPLSVSSTLTPEGMLVVSVRRAAAPPSAATFRSEARL